jgi:NADP-dependent 3-hydroxy acid dehydrogenase YdfG
MPGQLEGTVALVTGASSGIGAAVAQALAGAGATVALAARRRDRLDALAAAITGRAGRALVVPADLADPDQAAAVVRTTVAELGRLDTLVNNAGLMLLGTAEDTPFAEWQRMVDVNVTGLIACAHAALPHLLSAAAGGPRRVADMVNISSTAGRVTRGGRTVYSMTKYGLSGFAESLRQEVATRHVRISLVEPGATVTELRGHNRPEVAGLAGAPGDTRWLDPADVADAVAYIVTRPRHVAVNELMVRPTEQA